MKWGENKRKRKLELILLTRSLKFEALSFQCRSNHKLIDVSDIESFQEAKWSEVLKAWTDCQSLTVVWIPRSRLNGWCVWKYVKTHSQCNVRVIYWTKSWLAGDACFESIYFFIFPLLLLMVHESNGNKVDTITS